MAANPFSSSGAPVYQDNTYLLNPNTKKIHYSYCGTLEEDGDYIETSDYKWAIYHGYEPCKICKPKEG